MKALNECLEIIEGFCSNVVCKARDVTEMIESCLETNHSLFKCNKNFMLCFVCSCRKHTFTIVLKMYV